MVTGPKAKDTSITAGEDRGVLWLGRGSVPIVLTKFATRARLVLHTRADKVWPAPRIALVQGLGASAGDDISLEGRRIAVLHPDPGAADALAEAVRARGARAVVLSLSEAAIARAEALDPEVIVLNPTHMLGACRSTVDALWNHTRMRWTPILLVPDSRLGPAGINAPDVRSLAVEVGVLCADHASLEQRARREGNFEFQLQQLGPTRVLRTLLESGGSLRAHFAGPTWVIEVDVTEGIVVGARAGEKSVEEETLLGVHALAALNAETSATVRVRAVKRPAVTNVMAPLEALLLGDYRAPTFVSERPLVVGAVHAELPQPQVRELETQRAENSNAEHKGFPEATRGVGALPPVRMSVTGLPPPAVRVAAAPQQPPRTDKSVAGLGAARRAPSTLRLSPFALPATAPARRGARLAASELEGAIASAFAQYEAPAPPSAQLPALPQPARLPAPERVPATKLVSLRPEDETVGDDPQLEIEIFVSAPPPKKSVLDPNDRTPHMNTEGDDVARAPAGVATQAPPRKPAAKSAGIRVAAFALAVLLVGAGGWLVLGGPSRSMAPATVAGASLPSAEREVLAARGSSEPATPAAAVEPPPTVDLGDTPTAAGAGEPVLLEPPQGAAEVAADEPRELIDAPAAPPAPATGAPEPVGGEPASQVEGDAPAASESGQPGPIQPAAAARANALVVLAHQLRREGQLDGARQKYQDALAVAPGYPRALAGLAESYLTAGDAVRALKAAQELLTRRTRFADDLRLLGDIYMLAGNQAEAIDAYRRASSGGSRIARERLKTLP